MRLDRHGIAVALAIALFILPNQRRILAMCGELQRCFGENTFERLRVVDEHVARRCAHEDLDAARVRRREALDLLEVRVGRAEIEPVVDVARRGSDLPLLGERGAIRRRRARIRHVEEARDAAAQRSQRLRRQRRLVREARLAAVHLIVDEARQQVLAVEVDRRRAGRYCAGADALDTIAANQHVGSEDASLVDELPVDQQKRVHESPMSSLIWPKIDPSPLRAPR